MMKQTKTSLLLWKMGTGKISGAGMMNVRGGWVGKGKEKEMEMDGGIQLRA